MVGGAIGLLDRNRTCIARLGGVCTIRYATRRGYIREVRRHYFSVIARNDQWMAGKQGAFRVSIADFWQSGTSRGSASWLFSERSILVSRMFSCPCVSGGGSGWRRCLLRTSRLNSLSGCPRLLGHSRPASPANCIRQGPRTRMVWNPRGMWVPGAIAEDVKGARMLAG